MGATGIAMPLDLLRELQKISGANDKQMFLRQHMNDQGFLKLLYYAVHPLLTYKVSEATLRGSVQYDPAITLIFTNIFEVCEKLSGMNAIDDVTLYQVKAFLSGQNEQDKELYVTPSAGMGLTPSEKTLLVSVTSQSFLSFIREQTNQSFRHYLNVWFWRIRRV